MTSEHLNQRMASGASWDDFCDALKRAGRVVLRDGSPKDPFDQAEGYRYLSRPAPTTPVARGQTRGSEIGLTVFRQRQSFKFPLQRAPFA